MLQELLGDSGGGGGLFGVDSKFSFHGVVLEGLPSVSPSPSASSSSGATASNTTANPPTENLKCPRCDSPNTKFCYYNNYNLTQPRHFCKTCRRYWTKGGALRNIPIGGGCRKNKTTIVSTTSASGKSAAGKAKTTVASTEVVRANVRSTGFDHQEQSTNPILWGSPQSSHLLALLRATPHSSPNPNPNPNPNYSCISNLANIKDEGYMTRKHGLDPPAQVPIGLYNSLFGNKSQQHQNQHHYHQQQNLPHSTDAQNTGIQDLYQRLRSSVNYYPDQSSATVLMTSSSSSMQMTSSSSSMTEAAAPIVGGDFSSWNSPFSWSDLPTTTGAFP